MSQNYRIFMNGNIKCAGINTQWSETWKELKSTAVDTAVISETKKTKGTTELAHCILIYYGVSQDKWASAGVAIFIIKSFWKSSFLQFY